MKVVLSYVFAIVSVLIFPLLFGFVVYYFYSKAVANGHSAFERCKMLAWCSIGGLLFAIGLLYGSTFFQVTSSSIILVTISRLLTYSLVVLAVVSFIVLVVDFAIMMYLGWRH